MAVGVACAALIRVGGGVRAAQESAITSTPTRLSKGMDECPVRDRSGRASAAETPESIAGYPRTSHEPHAAPAQT